VYVWQIGCALLSHTLASIIWHQSMLDRHPAAVVAALHCGHPDMVVDTAVTAGVQFVSVFMLGIFTLRCGSVVVDLCEMIGQILINALIIAAGSAPVYAIHSVIIAINVYTNFIFLIIQQDSQALLKAKYC